MNENYDAVIEAAKALAQFSGGNVSSTRQDQGKYRRKVEAHKTLQAAIAALEGPDTGATEEVAKGENVRKTRFSQETLDESIKFYRALMREFGVKKRHRTTNADAAKVAGATEAQMSRRSRLFQHLGLLKIEFEYEWQKAMVFWTMLKPAYEGIAAIEQWYSDGGTLTQFDGDKAKAKQAAKAAAKAEAETEFASTNANPENVPDRVSVRDEIDAAVTLDEAREIAPKTMAKVDEIVATRYERTPVAIRLNGDQPVEAIAGPDAPLPFESLRSIRKDEAGGLIEAARQYTNRQTAIEQSFRSLEALGIKVNREEALKAVTFERDEVMEAVAGLLPYITELESKVDQVGAWKAELTQLRREKSQLSDMYNREKDANKRLSERNAQLVAGPR